MDKTPNVFERKGGELLEETSPFSQHWVFAGEGIATHKWDGTGALVKAGICYLRRTVPGGKPIPEGFVPFDDEQATIAAKPERGPEKCYGYVPKASADNKAWIDADVEAEAATLPDGTYELCGPGIQSNIERFEKRTLVPHGAHIIEDFPRTKVGMKAYFEARPDMEGVVFWHTDGRRAKIRGVDFGVKRVPRVPGGLR